jgi:hypothetical protein
MTCFPLGVFVGAFIGVVAMAVLSMARYEDY